MQGFNLDTPKKILNIFLESKKLDEIAGENSVNLQKPDGYSKI